MAHRPVLRWKLWDTTGCWKVDSALREASKEWAEGEHQPWTANTSRLEKYPRDVQRPCLQLRKKCAQESGGEWQALSSLEPGKPLRVAKALCINTLHDVYGFGLDVTDLCLSPFLLIGNVRGKQCLSMLCGSLNSRQIILEFYWEDFVYIWIEQKERLTLLGLRKEESLRYTNGIL